MFEVEVYGHHRRRLAAKAPAIMAECHLALAGIERVYKVSLAGHAADEQRVVVPMGSFGREGDSQTPRPVMEAVARTRSQRSRRGGHWNGLGEEAVKRHQRGARLASRAAGAGNGRRVYNTGGRTGENQVVVQANPKTRSLAGPEEWKFAASLEAVANRTRTLYLNSTDGQANDALHSGTLGPEKPAALPAASVPDRYVYDPLDLRPGALETADNPNYLTDQTARK